jgi:hypothetical protein
MSAHVVQRSILDAGTTTDNKLAQVMQGVADADAHAATTRTKQQ